MYDTAGIWIHILFPLRATDELHIIFFHFKVRQLIPQEIKLSAKLPLPQPQFGHSEGETQPRRRDLGICREFGIEV